jgi:phosphatidylserine/phosphatidylglycerophosphate/cardiolipin synthase-like enzyme
MAWSRLILAILGLTACSSGATDIADAGDASANADVSVVDAGSSLVLITDPDEGMSWLSTFIGTAKTSIDMTMYELTDTTITSLLTTAVTNGVTVRVILDQNLEKTDNTPAYQALSAGGVSVHWANPTYAATHQKTVTVDGATSAIMTMNLTPDDYATSRDFAVITTDAADVAAIETVFAADFASASITPPTGDDLVWSPTGSQTALVGLIQGAQQSLYIENEEMGDSTIVSALSSAASDGIAVHVIMEDSRSYQSEFETLQAAGVALAMYEHQALYIHAKIIVADFGTTQAKAFVGSENFTNPSLNENRELGLITSDPAVVTSLHTTLQADFDGGTPFVPYDGGFSDAATD